MAAYLEVVQAVAIPTMITCGQYREYRLKLEKVDEANDSGHDTAARRCLLAACSDHKRGLEPSDVIRGSGVPATQNYLVVAFDELVMSAAGDMSITLGSPQSLSVTVDDNIMPHVTMDLVDRWLVLGIDEEINATDYDLTINIVVTDLESLILAGVETFTGQNLPQTDRIELTPAGVGAIQINTSNRLHVIISGIGNVLYFGRPLITWSITGSGRVIDAN